MRRHAKASSAGSTPGIGSSRGLFGRAFATRGGLGDAEGSGAPPRGRIATFLAPLAVAASLLAFTAAPALAANPPKVSVGTTVPSDSALTFATLGGTVNPEGQATTYFFEYGKTTAYGDDAPAGGTSAGSGTADVSVSRKVSELELDTTYHYRVVATNASGTTNGPDLTFETGPDLANGLHYEMVSPPDTNGSPLTPKWLSLDGNRIAMNPGAQGFGDAQSHHGVSDRFLATRTASGWITVSMSPPQGPSLDSTLGRVDAATSDLGTMVAHTATEEQYEVGAGTLRLMRPGNLTYMAYPEYRVVNEASEYNNVIGTPEYSDDLMHAYFDTVRNHRLLASELPFSPKSESSFRIYEMTADPPALRPVAVDSSGNELAPVCLGSGIDGYGADAGGGRGINAISADGSKIFFNVRPGTPITTCAAVPARVYARINATTTVEISASECQPACASPQSDAVFLNASNDGSTVLFATSQQLVNGDLDATRDIYRYDFAKPAGQHLSLVSAGDASDPTPGSGAQVKNLARMSSDGSHIYFVAGGVLTTGANSYGQVAQAGANNLYLFEPGSGKTVFLARLAATDSVYWSSPGSTGMQPSDASGRFLLLRVNTPIAPDDTDTVADLYRFDAQRDQLLKVTPGNTADSASATAASAETSPSPQEMAISADGSVISFETVAPLQASDTNGVGDVYLWHNGSVSLLSDGKAPRGSSFAQLSTAGDEVTFATSAALVPKDVNSGISTYVARAGADVEPPIVTPPPPCAGNDACRGSAPAAPAVLSPSTPGFSGPGNEAAPRPGKKPHKKKHHKKKQQRKTHRAHRHSTNRAG